MNLSERAHVTLQPGFGWEVKSQEKKDVLIVCMAVVGPMPLTDLITPIQNLI